jgi:hypothetical protein
MEKKQNKIAILILVSLLSLLLVSLFTENSEKSRTHKS